MKTKLIVCIYTILFVFACYDFSIKRGDGGAVDQDAADASTEGVWGGEGEKDGSKTWNDSAGGTNGIDNGQAGVGGSGVAGGSAGSAGDRGSYETPAESCSVEKALRCSSRGVGQREVCQGGKWKPAESCAYSEICSSKLSLPAGTCQKLDAVCQGNASQAVCDGQGVMYQCNAEGMIESQNACSSARHCQTGLPKRKCATCIPGEFRCTGAKLESCAADGSGFTAKSKQCDTVALCNDKVGECTTSACVPNKFVCDGDMLRTCNKDQTALEDVKPCESDLCDAVAGECDVCTPGEKTCDGDTVVTCNTQGQGYTRSACSGNTTQCTGGKCVACTQNSECDDPGTCKQRYCNTAKGTCEPKDMYDHDTCDDGVCSGGVCVGCIDNSDCKKTGMRVCDTARGACVECVGTSCPAGSSCNTNNKCVVNCGNGKVDPGETCDTAASSSPPGSGPYRCDKACLNRTAAYVPCKPGETTSVSAPKCQGYGGACGNWSYCQPLCNQDSDCPKPTGKEQPRCSVGGTIDTCTLYCSSNADCPSFLDCNSGYCNNTRYAL